MPERESFTAKFKPVFDQDTDQWVLKMPASAVCVAPDGSYEVRLPVYAARTLAIGGNILRPMRKKYRDWLLAQQGGTCAVCGEGERQGNEWNLDHQPPMASPGSRFIDYGRVTKNRVIHHSCDSAQNSKKSLKPL